MKNLNKIQKEIILDTSFTSVWNIVAKGFGLLIPIFIAKWFGASLKTDIFFFSYSIIWSITTIFRSIGGIITIPFIAEKKESKENINGFISSLIIYNLLFSILAIALFIIFSYFTIDKITNFKGVEARNTFILFLILLSPTIIFQGTSSYIESIANYGRNFWITYLALGFRSILILLVIYLFKLKLSIFCIIVGYLLGELLYLLLVALLTIKYHGFIFSFDAKYKLKNYFKTAKEQAVYIITGLCSIFIDKSMVSYIGIGKVTILEYSEKAFLIFYNLLPIIFSKVLLTHWSFMNYQQKKESIENETLKLTIGTLIIGMPISFMLFINKNLISKALYSTVNITSHSFNEIIDLIGLQMLLLIPSTVTLILSKYFYVKKLTSILIYIGFVKIVLNVFGNYIGIKFFGLNGVLYSSLFHSSVASLILFIIVRNRAKFNLHSTQQS